MKKNIGSVLLSREFMLLIILMIAVSIISNSTKFFFTVDNLRGLFFTISVNSIMMIGMTIVLIAGSFDMSIGSVYPALGLIAGFLFKHQVPILGTILITLSVGAFIGFFIGYASTKLRVSAFIASLSIYFMFIGLSYIIGRMAIGKGVAEYPTYKNFPEAFLKISGTRFFGFETIDIYAVVLLVLFLFLLSKNVFFRQNFYIGGNESAAKLAGIKVDFVRICDHILLSSLVATAALLRISRTGAASSQQISDNTTLVIIASAFIGGASLKGGKGSIAGGFLAIILMSVLNDGFTLMNINVFFTNVLMGVILLFIVIFDEFIKPLYLKRIKVTIT